jgi:predicted membrane channel-forming protein YqfA (hemolysin III family)
MTNLKDKVSNYCAILLAISGAILALTTQGVVLPSWLLTGATVVATVSTAIIGILTGKKDTLKA